MVIGVDIPSLAARQQTCLLLHSYGNLMKKQYSFSGLVLATTLSAFSVASAAEELQEISLRFAGEFAGLPFDCSARYENIGLTNATVAGADFRLYVSRIRMLDADGRETAVTLQDHGPWQHDGIALLDFENGSGNCGNGTAQTNDVIKVQVPAGDYRGVAFDVGIPFEHNHQDPTLAASPLNLTALFWNWRGGYRFLRVDLLPEGDSMRKRQSAQSGHGSGKQATSMPQMADMKPGHTMKGNAMSGHGPAGWALHIGSTGCLADSPTSTPSECTAPNRIAVSFPEADPQSSVFVIDPAAVLSESDVTHNTEGTSPGCMSAPDDPECAPVLKALGLTSDSIDQQLVSVR